MSERSRFKLVAFLALGVLGVLVWLVLDGVGQGGGGVVGSENAQTDDVAVGAPTASRQPSPIEDPLPVRVPSDPSEMPADPFLTLDPLNAPDYQSAVFVQKIQRLQKRWESGQPDPGWTAQMVSHVSSQMAQHAIIGRVAEVACRTTLCRITMEFDSIEKMSKLNHFEYPADHSGYHTTHVGDGQYSGRIFVVPPSVSLASIFTGPAEGLKE